MARKTKIFILAVVLVAGLCGAMSCQRIKELLPQQEQQMVGGYSKLRKLSAEEVALFERAVSGLQGAEYKPVSVATQIVAGVNYRFLCKARSIDESGKRGKRFYAVIVVHKPLAGQGEERILSIEKGKK